MAEPIAELRANLQVAAKQVVFHDGDLFVVDAAGQLWWSRFFKSDEPYWQQVVLPPFKV